MIAERTEIKVGIVPFVVSFFEARVNGRLAARIIEDAIKARSIVNARRLYPNRIYDESEGMSESQLVAHLNKWETFARSPKIKDLLRPGARNQRHQLLNQIAANAERHLQLIRARRGL